MNLVDCYAPAFLLVEQALNGDACMETLREEAARQVEQGVVTASAEYTPATMLRSRRLVSMWMDNRLGGDEWAGRDIWRANPLLPEKSGGGEAYLLNMAGHLDSGNAEDAQLAMLMLECLGRGFNLDGTSYNTLLGLLTERFKGDA